MAATMKTTLIILIAVALIIDIAIISVLLFDLQPRLGGSLNLEPTVELTIYGGEIMDEEGIKYGYGFSPDAISSPGPNLEFKQGDIVKFTFINKGTVPHTFAVVSRVDPVQPQLIDSTDTGNVLPDDQAILVVQFNQVGTLYYQCTVPGHSELGMWGNITISQ